MSETTSGSVQDTKYHPIEIRKEPFDRKGAFLFKQQCQNIIQEIMKIENSFFFFKPVDPEQDRAPDYYQVIIQPMSIFNVQMKLDNNEYHTPNEFIQDMRLIWYNAQHYNAPTHPVFKAAENLAAKFELLASTLPRAIEETDLNCNFQREIELRFARYRMNKKTHL
ncbi:Bromodomain containing protein [Tritrichomonas foetus]|uniref:Bromodomain containing protein n=1 Tax=Tritrichomonas foetus TaxID=1144522 RepID=A0A1J4JV10_9EUKA|nr:Bromodomain containing protein [Tritrichomonas foetus]|eukprot:OHT02280.1 Bromodomain containing protein [Tritrichomonas foetus]